MSSRIPLLTLALTAALAGPALAAESDSETVNISGTVSKICTLGAPTPASVDLGELINTSGAEIGRLATIADREIELPNSFCNYAGTKLTVEGRALLADDTSTPPANFSRAVNFSSTVDGWAATPAEVTTAATATGADPTASADGGVVGAPRMSDLTVTLSDFSAPGDALLVAGGYEGSVTVTLGPDMSTN